MAKTGQQQPNLLEYRPNPKIQWQKNDNNRIVLLAPKFTNRFLAKVLLPRLKRPYNKIKLDEFGSWVWNEIDGQKTVYQIGLLMKERFGNEAEPIFERLGKFINILARYKYITLEKTT
ncbi:PqqD family protein [candidate division KSB1 bacterium]|nr:PqqD family protein [candidate division KSB1 bacterium]